MQTIKVKSGAVSIRIEKDPMDVQGVSLRKLTIEGNVGSVRRYYYKFYRVFNVKEHHL